MRQITIRFVTPNDASLWLGLRRSLWPHASEDEHATDIAAFLSGHAREPLQVLIAFGQAGAAVGLAELSIRPYAEGCDTHHVACIEGWYVIPEARRQGVGTALVRAAEDWGRSQGCTEFASSAELANAAAHTACGFTETGQIRCFRKAL